MTEDALKKSLGGVLRTCRKQAKRSLSDVAAAADMSLGYLSQIELGKNAASLFMLWRITAALGVSLAQTLATVEQSAVPPIPTETVDEQPPAA